MFPKNETNAKDSCRNNDNFHLSLKGLTEGKNEHFGPIKSLTPRPLRPQITHQIDCLGLEEHAFYTYHTLNRKWFDLKQRIGYIDSEQIGFDLKKKRKS